MGIAKPGPRAWAGRGALALTLVGSALAAAGAPAELPMRGISWVAGGPVDSARLAEVRALGAGWIAQTPFAFMRDPRSPELRFHTDHEVYWGESDAGLAETHRLAKRHGLKTLLKPHVWLRGSWPGEIAMSSESDWQRWFESYARFLLHHAMRAECEGFEMLAIGCELKLISRAREADMRGLIARVRAIYHGPLVYSANWDEVFEVPFWDALDYIGVNGYFPVSGVAERAWPPIAARLGELSARTGRPVLLTELGYAAVPDCTRRPWQDAPGAASAEGLECQARAIDAALAALWPQPWFAGAFAWKWFPDPARADDGRAFDVHGRPAEAVLRKWYRRPAPPAAPGAEARPRAVAAPR